MNESTLIGKTIQAVRTFPCNPVHPAWVDELTLPFATSEAFLELLGGGLVRIYPCEVETTGGTYPELGLALEQCDRDALRITLPSGQILEARSLSQFGELLPMQIARIQRYEVKASELRIYAPLMGGICFRHMMPPMTLGIGVNPRA